MTLDNHLEFIEDKNEIVPNLWLGSHPSTIHDMKHVFAMNGRPTYHVMIGQMVVCRPFDDCPRLPDVAMLYDTAEMVEKCISKGPTLVHCAAGINRSALIVALVLINRGMKPDVAIELIRAKRSKICLSNDTFVNWLRTLDYGPQK